MLSFKNSCMYSPLHAPFEFQNYECGFVGYIYNFLEPAIIISLKLQREGKSLDVFCFLNFTFCPSRKVRHD